MLGLPLLAPILALTLVTAPALAQRSFGSRGEGTEGGTLGRVRYAAIEARAGAGRLEQHWLRVLLLWKPDSAQAEPLTWTPEQRARRDSVMRIQRARGRAAEDSGRWVLTNRSDWDVRVNAEYDRGRRVLFVLGQRFSVPERDSTLVVLLESRGADGPAIVGSRYASFVIPQEYWTRSWTSGDTTFT
ncbi:MAG TPA: hypothetical protein VEA99_16295, partial [Gemmatimonadaceae bacterium]|nr:hypothetical protein [Gemmatimonadaceae bacterium]